MTISLWDEIKIADLKISNRALMPAMGTGYGSPEGS